MRPELLPPQLSLLDLVRLHGSQSTSFLTLYEGYSYFFLQSDANVGFIAYVDTRTAWVAAGEPVAEEKNQALLVEEFLKAAKEAKKAVVLLPVGQKVADVTRSLGFSVYQIGSEPWQELKNASEYSERLKSMNPARQIKAKGAVVEQFDPMRVAFVVQRELKAITKKWLDSRKSATLGFLNRLDPWRFHEQKRYFLVRKGNQIFGYLAAVPVFARNGWYLVDLVRDPQSPVGTTELLVIEAMEQLRKEGAAHVTLGFSPLALLDAKLSSRHPVFFKLANAIYNRFGGFYGFKSLHLYKDKFKPTRWEPMYLAASPKLNIKTARGIMQAIYPQGTAHVVSQGIQRSLREIEFGRWYSRFLSDDFVVRSMPTTFFRLVFRARASLSLMAVNALMFVVSTDPSFNLRPKLAQRMGYSLDHMLHFELSDFASIFMSSFLHWNQVHLYFNLAVMAVAGVLLELTAGTAILLAAYVSGVMLSNILTSASIALWLSLFTPQMFEGFRSDVDIGASLGTFACIGALSHFLKHGRALVAGIAGVTLAYIFFTGELLGFNHITAIAIGLLVASAMTRKQ